MRQSIMRTFILLVRDFLGFSESGASLLGKLARKLLGKNEIRHTFGVGIVSLVSATFFIHSLANLGGPLTFNPVNNSSGVLADVQTNNTVQKPLDFEYESRGFSWFHTGVDLVVPVNTPVKPVMEGVVEATPYEPTGYGYHVILQHGQGYESVYGHLSEIDVKVGDKVGVNTILGLSGSTGFSTGPHLHLEVRLNGQPINPAELVPGVI